MYTKGGLKIDTYQGKKKRNAWYRILVWYIFFKYQTGMVVFTKNNLEFDTWDIMVWGESIWTFDIRLVWYLMLLLIPLLISGGWHISELPVLAGSYFSKRTFGPSFNLFFNLKEPPVPVQGFFFEFDKTSNLVSRLGSSHFKTP
jgi:hypothetical protein